MSMVSVTAGAVPSSMNVRDTSNHALPDANLSQPAREDRDTNGVIAEPKRTLGARDGCVDVLPHDAQVE